MARPWLGRASGVLMGLLTGMVLSSGERTVGAAPAISAADTWPFDREVKREHLMEVEVDSDTLLSRVGDRERRGPSLQKHIATFGDSKVMSKDYRTLGKRHTMAEARWARDVKKLKARLTANEKALKKLCSRSDRGTTISKPGASTTLMGSAGNGYEPVRWPTGRSRHLIQTLPLTVAALIDTYLYLLTGK